MAIIDLTCPMCGNTSARKLSLIYEEGRSTSSGTLESVGTFNTIGRQQIKTKGTTAGIHQTDASRAASPPPLPEFVTEGQQLRNNMLIGAIVLGPAAGYLSHLMYGHTDASLIVTLVVALIFTAYGLKTDTREKDGEFEKHRQAHRGAYDTYDRWENTFACGACGNRFQPTNS